MPRRTCQHARPRGAAGGHARECRRAVAPHRHRRRRQRGLDGRGGPGARARRRRHAHHPGRVRGDRHGRCGRSDDSADRIVQRLARHRRKRVPARDPGQLQAGHRIRRLAAAGTALLPSVRRLWRRLRHGAVRRPVAAHAPRRPCRTVGGVFAQYPGGDARALHAAAARRCAAVAVGLRLPFRHRAVCAAAARVCRGPRRDAAGRQGRTGAATFARRRYRLDRACVRHAHRRRFLHRLLRLARPADRGCAWRRVCRLVALAVQRPRGGGAIGACIGVHALHPIDRARGGLAMADSVAASHRQRLCLFERASVRRCRRRDAAGQPGRRGAGRAAHAALPYRPARGVLVGQLPGAGAGGGIPETAGIDQHPPDPGRHRPLPGDAARSRRQPGRHPPLQTADGAGIRQHPRLHHPALPRHRAARRVLGTRAHDADPRQPGRAPADLRALGPGVARGRRAFQQDQLAGGDAGAGPERARLRSAGGGNAGRGGRGRLQRVAAAAAMAVERMPAHADFIRAHCAAT